MQSKTDDRQWASRLLVDPDRLLETFYQEVWGLVIVDIRIDHPNFLIRTIFLTIESNICQAKT
jgi:hypothetical protein